MKISMTTTISLLCVLPAMAAPLHQRATGATGNAMANAEAKLEASQAQTQRLEAQIEEQRNAVLATKGSVDGNAKDMFTRDAEPIVVFPNQNLGDHGLAKPFEGHLPFVSKIPVHDQD